MEEEQYAEKLNSIIDDLDLPIERNHPTRKFTIDIEFAISLAEKVVEIDDRLKKLETSPQKEMNEEKARSLLWSSLNEDGILEEMCEDGMLQLEGEFSIGYLEALVWWVKNKCK